MGNEIFHLFLKIKMTGSSIKNEQIETVKWSKTEFIKKNNFQDWKSNQARNLFYGKSYGTCEYDDVLP